MDQLIREKKFQISIKLLVLSSLDFIRNIKHCPGLTKILVTKHRALDTPNGHPLAFILFYLFFFISIRFCFCVSALRLYPNNCAIFERNSFWAMHNDTMYYKK